MVKRRTWKRMMSLVVVLPLILWLVSIYHIASTQSIVEGEKEEKMMLPYQWMCVVAAVAVATGTIVGLVRCRF